MQDELEEIEVLRQRVDDLAKQRAEEDTVKVPMLRGPHQPTQEEVERHELTHANFKPWCSHCQAGLAQRERHVRKNKKLKTFKKRTAKDDADVPDVEKPIEERSKFSIDYFKLISSEEGETPYSIVMVNHREGGVFSYATPGKGIQGDSYWVSQRLAKDIDNRGRRSL